MRNVFDQYKTPENRLTHALTTALAEDRELCKSFIGWVCGSTPTGRKRLEILGQRLPGEPETDEDENARRSLPDAWIHDGESWSLLIESKISSTLDNDQLRRHLRTAERRNFTQVTLLAIAIAKPELKLPEHVVVRTWPEVYEWLNTNSDKSDWALRSARYFEVAERKFSNDGYLQEGTLTRFDGFPFGHDEPYNYFEAKRLLRLAMEELRQRTDLIELGMNPLASGRGAITGSQEDQVWDYLRLQGAHETFTRYPHLTLSVQSDKLMAVVILPHDIQGQLRRRLIDMGFDGFRKILAEVAANLSSSLDQFPGASPTMEAVQRHYPSQRSVPILDAKLTFDLRTAFPEGSDDGRVKHQPQWLDATWGAFSRKRSNFQLAVGATFPYRVCEATTERRILDGIAVTWIGCRPLLRGMGLPKLPSK